MGIATERHHRLYYKSKFSLETEPVGYIYNIYNIDRFFASVYLGRERKIYFEELAQTIVGLAVRNI